MVVLDLGRKANCFPAYQAEPRTNLDLHQRDLAVTAGQFAMHGTQSSPPHHRLFEPEPC